jgi:hypothetical protein
MNKEKVLVIADREELYDKCENMEQLFSEYYLPLLDVHYRKTYDLQNRIDKAIEYINHYETIRGYYEYEENGYDEYNYEDDLKQELLEILGENNE